MPGPVPGAHAALFPARAIFDRLHLPVLAKPDRYLDATFAADNLGGEAHTPYSAIASMLPRWARLRRRPDSVRSIRRIPCSCHSGENLAALRLTAYLRFPFARRDNLSFSYSTQPSYPPLCLPRRISVHPILEVFWLWKVFQVEHTVLNQTAAYKARLSRYPCRRA